MTKIANADFLRAVGHNLRVIRVASGMTQKVLAFGCNMETASLSRIENGKTNTSLDVIKTLCDQLHVQPMRLFDFH